MCLVSVCGVSCHWSVFSSCLFLLMFVLYLHVETAHFSLFLHLETAHLFSRA